MRPALIPLALLAPALVGARSAPPPTPAVFDPIAFFEGRTRGSGALSIILRPPRPLTVEGEGRLRADGALLLRQRIEEEGRPARTRRWEIRRVGPNSWAGTLTDATGPVLAEAAGPTLRIRYPSRQGRVEQRLTLSPDGRTARNRLTVKRLGVVIATVEEVIRKRG